MKPLNDQILIKLKQEENVSDSGIVLTTPIEKKIDEGEVAAIGDGKITDNGTRTPLSVAVGDVVMFKAYAVQKLSHNGERYALIKEEEIIGIYGAKN